MKHLIKAYIIVFILVALFIGYVIIMIIGCSSEKHKGNGGIRAKESKEDLLCSPGGIISPIGETAEKKENHIIEIKEIGTLTQLRDNNVL